MDIITRKIEDIPLTETIVLMNSSDYKDRFRGEY